MDKRWQEIFNLLKDKSVSEIQANGPNEFFIKKSGQRQKINIKFGDIENYYQGIESSLVPNMRPILKWDRTGYLFEGPLILLVGGEKIQARCHIVLPPAALYPQITIAKKSTSLISLDDIAANGSMALEMKNFLKMAVEKRLNIVISGGTGAGKAVSLDTKIPTPTGFTTMGEIKVGDEAFDRFGNVTTVLNKFPQPERTVYKLELETGVSINCDKDHNWMVSLDNGNSYQVRTTEELYEIDQTILIPLTMPIKGTENLENPYSLGTEIAKNKKSFPSYINVTEEDRIDLLSGIVDEVGKLFFGEFRLPYQDEVFNNNVLKLASGLGCKVYFEEDIRIVSLYPLSKKEWRVKKFKEFWDVYNQPLSLSKNVKVSKVVKTEEVVDMACITVDGPDSTYLITDGFVTTHNTTMLESFTRYIDKEARVGIAEDTPELNLPEQPNTTFLHSVPWQPGLDPNNVATLDWVVQQFQRMRTDILLVGEVRGKEFASFLIAANSGMDGSMTTIHASNSKKALNKMTNFALIGSERQPVRAINTDIANSIDIVVQLGILYDGRYRVLEITEVTNTLSKDEQATISTELLYKYEPATDSFIKAGTMTDALREKLESRNADISPFLAQPVGTEFSNKTPNPSKAEPSSTSKKDTGRKMGLPFGR